MQNKKLGHWGESVAIRYLRRKGFVLLQRNVYTRFGELDLVMLDGKELVFVEVKTRRSDRFGTGFDAVNRTKLLRMERAAAAYLGSWTVPVSYRIDVLVITKKAHGWTVEHIDHAALDALPSAPEQSRE